MAPSEQALTMELIKREAATIGFSPTGGAAAKQARSFAPFVVPRFKNILWIVVFLLSLVVNLHGRLIVG